MYVCMCLCVCMYVRIYVPRRDGGSMSLWRQRSFSFCGKETFSARTTGRFSMWIPTISWNSSSVEAAPKSWFEECALRHRRERSYAIPYRSGIPILRIHSAARLGLGYRGPYRIVRRHCIYKWNSKILQGDDRAGRPVCHLLNSTGKLPRASAHYSKTSSCASR